MSSSERDTFCTPSRVAQHTIAGDIEFSGKIQAHFYPNDFLVRTHWRLEAIEHGAPNTMLRSSTNRETRLKYLGQTCSCHSLQSVPLLTEPITSSVASSAGARSARTHAQRFSRTGRVTDTAQRHGTRHRHCSAARNASRTLFSGTERATDTVQRHGTRHGHCSAARDASRTLFSGTGRVTDTVQRHGTRHGHCSAARDASRTLFSGTGRATDSGT